MSPKDFKITLDPISDEDIKENHITDSQLWFVRQNDIMQGPFLEGQVRDFLAKNAPFMMNFEACNAEDMNWKPIFEHARLQRRTPNSPDKKFDGVLLLIDGLKVGPYSNDEIKEKLERKEIGLQDLYSEDSGHTWKKLFDNALFDRRVSEKKLPFFPDDNSFNHATEEVQKYLVEKEQEIDVEGDALVDLAYHGDETNDLPDSPPPLDYNFVGEKVGKGPQYDLKDVPPDLPPLPDSEEEVMEMDAVDKKNQKKKVVAATVFSFVLIMMIVSRGRFTFGEPDKTKEIVQSKSAPERQMSQNYRQNKSNTPQAAERQPANNRRIIDRSKALNKEKQARLKNEFKNAVTIQETHKKNMDKKKSKKDMTRREAANDDYDYDVRDEEFPFETDDFDNVKRPKNRPIDTEDGEINEQMRELSPEEEEDGQRLIEEIRKEQIQIDDPDAEFPEDYEDREDDYPKDDIPQEEEVSDF
jgi:hypothetical protein